LPERAHLIQRERALENHLYNGFLSLVILLSDIKKEDIIEIAYLRKGHNPIFPEHYDNLFYFSFDQRIEKIHYRFLRDKNRKLHFKIDNPKLLEEHLLNDSQIETTLLISPTQVFESSGAPFWYMPFERLQVSDYQSWQEVSEWGKGLVEINKDALEEVGSVVKDWKKEQLTPEELIIKALLFVQNEIRYMGMEEGIHSHKPHSPLETLAKGYGDCKDKTLLLKSVMEALGIASAPCLVSTVYRDLIKDWLPSVSIFNHMILNVSWDGKDYWLDPTDKFQGGLLKDYSQTFYGCYLLLDGQPDCFRHPSPQNREKVMEIASHYKMKADYIELEIKTIYEGERANSFRSYLAYHGQAGVEKASKNYISKLYGVVETNNELCVNDDLRANQMTVIESYKLPNFFKSESVFLETLALEDYLPRKVSMARKYPLSLHFPIEIRESIRLSSDLPQRMKSEKKRVKHSGFVLDYEASMEGNDLLYSFFFKTLEDHVRPQDLESYRLALSKIWKILSISYQYAPLESDRSSLYWGMLLFSAIVSVCMFRFYRRVRVENEEKVRKKWLVSFFLLSTLDIIEFYFYFVMSEFEKNKDVNLTLTLLLKLQYTALILGMLKCLVTHVLVYQNKFKLILLGMLILMPFAELYRLMTLNFGCMPTLMWGITVITSSIRIYYWITSA
jgi:hypothetical protein